MRNDGSPELRHECMHSRGSVAYAIAPRKNDPTMDMGQVKSGKEGMWREVQWKSKARCGQQTAGGIGKESRIPVTVQPPRECLCAQIQLRSRLSPTLSAKGNLGIQRTANGNAQYLRSFGSNESEMRWVWSSRRRSLMMLMSCRPLIPDAQERRQ